MAHDVFVSYASRDEPIAQEVVRGLEAAGIRCWIAPRDIKAGDVWAEAIVTAVAQARCLVLVFSSHANRSGHVLNEVDAAVRGGATVLPLRVEDAMPEGAMAYHLRTRHWLDALGADRSPAIERLIGTVRDALAAPRGQVVPQTEFFKAATPPAPRPAVGAPARPPEAPRPADPVGPPAPPTGRRSWATGRRLGLGAALIVALGGAGRWWWTTRDVSGVSFTVIEAGGGAELRVAITTRPLRFFESGRSVPAASNRRYLTTFASAQSRYINVELGLDLPAPGRVLSVPITCSYVDQAGGIPATVTLANQIAASATTWQNAIGWGRESGGFWRAGTYRVDCRYGDRLVARSRFRVLE